MIVLLWNAASILAIGVRTCQAAGAGLLEAETISSRGRADDGLILGRATGGRFTPDAVICKTTAGDDRHR